VSSERIVSEEQIDREALVREVRLFSGLADADLHALADAAWIGTVPAGD
jgi:hypothetical protein